MSHDALLTRGCPPASCPSCEPQTPLRNHYFFGKLMDVPDFDVEQQYVVEKFKRHHQRLHGTGVICGLEVVAHPNPACRSRYVIVKPGAALDCCGNEILVLHEEVLDLHAYPEVHELFEQSAPEQRDHVLQFCIRYKECPTEQVPVLYDECGCDDTRCAPNRILETYEFDVLLNPALPEPAAPHAPSLAWTATVALSNAKAVVVDEASQRLYVAADLSPGGGIVQQFDLQTLAPIAPKTFATAVLAMALSGDGKQLHVAVAGATAAADATLEVLDTTAPAAFSGAPAGSATLPDSAGAQLRLRMLPSGELLTLAATATQSTIQLWDLSAATPSAISTGKAQINAPLKGLALASDGTTVYTAEAANTLHRLDTTAAGLNLQSIAVTSADVIALEVVQSTAPDALVWLEGSGKLLKLAKPDGTALAQASLPETPTGLVVAPGGRTAYVLMQPAAGPAQVVSLDLHRVLTSTTPVLGTPLAIGDAARSLALGGSRVFVAYSEGAAVLEISDADCEDPLKRHPCPTCETPDCVVLATVLRWRPGRRLEDPVDPPADPAADAAAGIARIDNDLGRQVVPSVADLAKAVLCLLEQGTGGGKGEQGPPGKDGTDGKDGKDGKDGTDGKDGKDGKDGTGLDWDYCHICDFNWRHGDTVGVNEIVERSRLVVAFDTVVLNRDIHNNSVRVQVAARENRRDVLLLCFCDLDLDDRLRGGHIERKCDARSAFTADPDPNAEVDALEIVLPGNLAKLARESPLLRLRILINGDFIRGRHAKTREWRALDADHIPKTRIPSPPGPPSPGELPEWIQPGDARFSGDGVEGGTFESWFDVKA